MMSPGKYFLAGAPASEMPKFPVCWAAKASKEQTVNIKISKVSKQHFFIFR
jgi:hypothetical protein